MLGCRWDNAAAAGDPGAALRPEDRLHLLPPANAKIQSRVQVQFSLKPLGGRYEVAPTTGAAGTRAWNATTTAAMAGPATNAGVLRRMMVEVARRAAAMTTRTSGVRAVEMMMTMTVVRRAAAGGGTATRRATAKRPDVEGMTARPPEDGIWFSSYPRSELTPPIRNRSPSGTRATCGSTPGESEATRPKGWMVPARIRVARIQP